MKSAFATVTRASARMKKTEDALEQMPASTAGQPASRIASTPRRRWPAPIMPPSIRATPSDR
jgi:hypothetical protein